MSGSVLLGASVATYPGGAEAQVECGVKLCGSHNNATIAFRPPQHFWNQASFLASNRCFGLCKYALVVELFWGETNHRTPTEISSIKEVAIAEQEEAGPELIRLPDVVAIKSDMIETRFWNWNYGFRPGNLHQYQEYSWADGGNYILKCSPSDYLQSTLIHVPFWVDKAPEIFTVISPSAIFVLRATVAKLHTVLGVVDSDLRE
ncbi:hypothetical protein C8J57DRAFT_1222173 [Mycena rebaudengoi]|nr:hypothetical protein C8J57DRAFT_1222173 [Mycena rebaudengoi]